jgi:biopolymer transport protein ExbD
MTPRDNLHSDAAENLDPPIIERNKEVVDAEMDITPMIDCVFLLLIFFIVCSTMEQQTPIDLAKARHGKGVSERDSMIISVGEGGDGDAPVFLADGVEGDPVTGNVEQQQQAISAAIEIAKREEGKQDVIIKADRHVAHRDVARVIKAVSNVESVNIHLAVMESN